MEGQCQGRRWREGEREGERKTDKERGKDLERTRYIYIYNLEREIKTWRDKARVTDRWRAREKESV